MNRPRVLITDASPVLRRALSSIVELDPRLELAATVGDFDQSAAAVAQFQPDALVFGCDTWTESCRSSLARVRDVDATLPIILVARLVGRHAEIALGPLSQGAIEIVVRPVGIGSLSPALRTLGRQLADRILGQCGASQPGRPRWLPSHLVSERAGPRSGS